MVPLKGAGAVIQLLRGFVLRTFLVVRVRINTFEYVAYLGHFLAICCFEQLLFSLAQGAQHALWETLPVGNGLLEVDIEILIVQAETVVALVRFLQLQQQVTLLPFVLSLLEHFIIIFLVTLVLTG